MSLSIVKINFIFLSFILVLFGFLVNFFEPYLPVAIPKFFRFGKFHSKIKHAFLEKLEVPKRWYKQYYIFAAPTSTFALGLLGYRYLYNGVIPDSIVSAMEFFIGKPLPSLVSPENTLLAMTLLVIHFWKRYYESHFISIYSDNKMNFGLHIIAFCHYSGVIMSVFAESQDLIKDTKVSLDWSRLTWLDYTFAGIFIVSTYLQYRCNIILSNLRKDKKGNVVTTSYKVPKGGLFDYITAPLQLTEIVLYLSLNVILRQGSTFYYVAAWVAINQMECAYLSHEWSLKTFKDYPKNRKVIIPFLY